MPAYPSAILGAHESVVDFGVGTDEDVALAEPAFDLIGETDRAAGIASELIARGLVEGWSDAVFHQIDQGTGVQDVDIAGRIRGSGKWQQKGRGKEPCHRQ
jgi:hypothetical protein